MLRQEELVEQPVHLQQAVAVQPHAVLIEPQKASTLQGTERSGKPLLNIDSEFALEVRSADVTELHLKDQFPDHTFLRARRQGAANRQSPFLQPGHIGPEVSLVLK